MLESFGGVRVTCRTGKTDVAGSTPAHCTAR